MVFYAPVSLLALPVVWLALVLVGYMGMFWALGVSSWWLAFTVSGSSLLTLGFAQVDDFFKSDDFLRGRCWFTAGGATDFVLPTMYSAFSRRETAVTMLGVRAGTPPSAVTMLTRYYNLHKLDKLTELWGNVGDVVRRYRGEPYLTRRAFLLSFSTSPTFLDNLCRSSA